MLGTRLVFKLSLLIFIVAIWGLVLIVVRLITGKPWSVIHKDGNVDRCVQSAVIVVPIAVFIIFFLVNNGYVHIR